MTDEQLDEIAWRAASTVHPRTWVRRGRMTNDDRRQALAHRAVRATPPTVKGRRRGVWGDRVAAGALATVERGVGTAEDLLGLRPTGTVGDADRDGDGEAGRDDA